MSTPNPVPPSVTVVSDPSPLPSATAVTTATAASTVLGFLASLGAAKLGVPVDVIGAALGLIFTGVTSLWHRAAPTVTK